MFLNTQAWLHTDVELLPQNMMILQIFHLELKWYVVHISYLNMVTFLWDCIPHVYKSFQGLTFEIDGAGVLSASGFSNCKSSTDPKLSCSVSSSLIVSLLSHFPDVIRQTKHLLNHIQG